MEQLILKAENLTGDTITVLQGHALEQKAPVKIIINGDIKSVGNFLKVRNNGGAGMQEVDNTSAIITTDKKNLTIKLQLDPENFYSPEIIGKLEASDELKPFAINENQTFTKEQLVKLIKFNKLFFDDATKHAEILLAFQKVSSTVNIRTNESADDRGNKERQFVKDVTTNAPTEFILNIPILKGFKPVRFRVEIGLDVTEGSARFWFESTELHEIMHSQVEKIFSEELKHAEGFVIINI